MSKNKQLKVTLLRSLIGRQKSHRTHVNALGLKKRHHSVMLEDTPSVRGLINKVSYMVEVEEI